MLFCTLVQKMAELQVTITDIVGDLSLSKEKRDIPVKFSGVKYKLEKLEDGIYDVKIYDSITHQFWVSFNLRIRDLFSKDETLPTS